MPKAPPGIFTTHYLEEAEQLCESMTVINKGKVIKEGKVKEIQQEFSEHYQLRTLPK